MPVTVLPGVVNLSGGIQIANVHWQGLEHHLLQNRRYLRSGHATMVQRDTHTGKTLILCGMGPSLADEAAAVLAAHPSADVWGCNKAAVWLHQQGHRVSAGFGIGREPAMAAEWEGAKPRMPFYVATHTHPDVTAKLVAEGRRLKFFHSVVVNIAKEQALWRKHFPPGIHVGIGTNVVTRAVAVAVGMGYAKIIVLGADCALRKGQLYAAGEARTFADVYAADPTVLRGTIDGLEWVARADMVTNAVDLVRISRMHEMAGGRMVLVGDTLPNALMKKDEAFLAQLPTLGQHQRVTGFSIMRPSQGL